MIKGRIIAKSIRQNLKSKINKLHTKPCLATILIGHDPASALYIRMKNRACKKVGIKTTSYQLPKGCDAEQLRYLVDKLNSMEQVSGILIEKPYVVKGAKETQIDDWISPKKDVDGTNYINVAKLTRNDPTGIYPCTPQAVVTLLKNNGIKNFTGKNIAIINRSEIVGKPLAIMLINAGAEVTVFNHNMQASELKDSDFDIIIAGTGHPNLITASMVKPNQILVPISEVKGKDDKLHGDFSKIARSKAKIGFSCIGNVGPLTITTLLNNIYKTIKNN